MKNNNIRDFLSEIYQPITESVLKLSDTLHTSSELDEVLETDEWECLLSDFAYPELLVQLLKDYGILISTFPGGWRVDEDDLKTKHKHLSAIVITMAFFKAAMQVIELERRMEKIKKILG